MVKMKIRSPSLNQSPSCNGIIIFLVFLQPIRIFITGPPAVGKTTVGKKLCDHYKLHHITVDRVVQEKIQQLVGSGRVQVGFSSGSVRVQVGFRPSAQSCRLEMETGLDH